MQMVVTDEDENFYHTLPKHKKIKKKNQQIHSLKSAVEANRPAAKKY